MTEQENGIVVNNVAALMTGVSPGYGTSSEEVPNSLVFYTLLVNESKAHCLFRTLEQAETYVLDFSEIASELKNVSAIRIVPVSVNPRNLFEMIDEIQDE